MHHHLKSKPLRRVSPKERAVTAKPQMMPRRGAGSLSKSHTRWCAVDPAMVFNDVLLDIAESNNDFAWACCPFHNDKNPSFSVNLRTGWYRCFSTSCGQTGTNIVSFVSTLLGLSMADARLHTEARYGR